MLSTQLFRKRFLPLIILALFALALTMCKSSAPDTGVDADLVATIAALQAELEAAQAAEDAAKSAPTESMPPTEEPTVAPVVVPSGEVSESFDADTGTFRVGEGMEISNGVYLMGPFEQCANDVANFDNPVGCNAVCQTCGNDLKNFTLKVQLAYEDGLSDRYYGVILRFVDEDGDSLLDFEDYLLALGFDTLNNMYNVYVHVPNDVNPWSIAKGGVAGLVSRGRMNWLEVNATNDGRIMDIFLNQSRLVKLTADAPQPGEALVRDWAESGSVGLVILGRRIQARFDNFSVEPLP